MTNRRTRISSWTGSGNYKKPNSKTPNILLHDKSNLFLGGNIAGILNEWQKKKILVVSCVRTSNGDGTADRTAEASGARCRRAPLTSTGWRRFEKNRSSRVCAYPYLLTYLLTAYLPCTAIIILRRIDRTISRRTSMGQRLHRRSE